MNILKEKDQFIFPVQNGTISQPGARTLDGLPQITEDDTVEDVGGPVEERTLDSDSEVEDFGSFAKDWI